MRSSTAEVRLADHLEPGDLVVLGSGIGEPESLVALLIEQREELHGIEVFVGISYSGELVRRLAASFPVASFGAMGDVASLASEGAVEVLPVHYVDIARHLRHRAAGRLVLLVQLAPADDRGFHSFGIAVDYTAELIDDARLVIAEVNDRVAPVVGPELYGDRIDVKVLTSRELKEVLPGPVSELHGEIAANVLPFIPHNPVLQLGIGGVPSAVAALLGAHRRGIRVHTGLVGDWLLSLEASGSLAPGSPIVVGGAAGSASLYAFLAQDSRVELRRIRELTSPDVTASLPGFVALNSALQVDLTGQVNAEVVGERYAGGVGGQVDFLRGAQLARDGASIIALPATAASGRLSRIVERLDSGVVTTARSGVDIVVTEFGAADLRGRDLRQRARAMAQIAAPEFRSGLASTAGTM